MQTKDLKPGTDYVYKERDWSTPTRVKVVEAKHVATVKRTVHRLSGIRRVSQQTTGVLVEVVTKHHSVDDLRKADAGFGEPCHSSTGETALVNARYLRKTWADYLAEERQKKAWAKEQANAEATERARRAEFAMQVHRRLLTLGTPVKGYSLWKDGDQAALVAAGFETCPGYYNNEVVMATFAVDDYMEKGVFPESVVMALMNEQAADNRHDGGYSLDELQDQED